MIPCYLLFICSRNPRVCPRDDESHALSVAKGTVYITIRLQRIYRDETENSCSVCARGDENKGRELQKCPWLGHKHYEILYTDFNNITIVLVAQMMNNKISNFVKCFVNNETINMTTVYVPLPLCFKNFTFYHQCGFVFPKIRHKLVYYSHIQH
jgi:hypothetical protein